MAGRSPLGPDKNHFHHRLSGSFGKDRARLIYVGLVAGAALIATFAPRFDAVYLGCLTAIYAVLLRPDLVGWHPKTVSTAGSIGPIPKGASSSLPFADVGVSDVGPDPLLPKPTAMPGSDATKTLH
jgi:hypothetical protein